MNIFEFMSDSPFLTFFLAWLLLKTVTFIFRMVNIFKNGWPPPHCDADGDIKSNEK